MGERASTGNFGDSQMVLMESRRSTADSVWLWPVAARKTGWESFKPSAAVWARAEVAAGGCEWHIPGQTADDWCAQPQMYGCDQRLAG